MVMSQIHIDAHPDDALPDLIPLPGMPFFTFPERIEQTMLYLQRNDVFIQVCLCCSFIKVFCLIIGQVSFASV